MQECYPGKMLKREYGLSPGLARRRGSITGVFVSEKDESLEELCSVSVELIKFAFRLLIGCVALI